MKNGLEQAAAGRDKNRYGTSANVIGATIAAADDQNVYVFGTALNWLVAFVLLPRKPRIEKVAVAPRQTLACVA